MQYPLPVNLICYSSLEVIHVSAPCGKLLVLFQEWPSVVANHLYYFNLGLCGGKETLGFLRTRQGPHKVFRILLISLLLFGLLASQL